MNFHYFLHLVILNLFFCKRKGWERVDRKSTHISKFKYQIIKVCTESYIHNNQSFSPLRPISFNFIIQILKFNVYVQDFNLNFITQSYTNTPKSPMHHYILIYLHGVRLCYLISVHKTLHNLC